MFFALQQQTDEQGQQTDENNYFASALREEPDTKGPDSMSNPFVHLCPSNN